MPSKTLHMGVTKLYLLRVATEVEEGKLVEFFPDWGGTREELIEAIHEDPRGVFVNCSCEKNEDGSCSGH